MQCLQTNHEQYRWLRQYTKPIVKNRQRKPYKKNVKRRTLNRTPSQNQLLTDLTTLICSYIAILPSLATVRCWLWLPLTDYCILDILRRFLALRSFYLKHLNRFRVQIILVFYYLSYIITFLLALSNGFPFN
jgi:hypothetical protein